ncbi:hypothetical protein [Vibrio phage JSF6]|nr:hypothetical protein [Vibrio phage JSF6]
MKFDIKIMGVEFASDEGGYLDLNSIWKGCNLDEKKRPSEWRNRKARYFRQTGDIITGSGVKLVGLPPVPFMKGTEVATIEYAKWAGLSIESHGVSLEVKKDEIFIGQLLTQIFPDIEYQKSYCDGKYLVDYYIPSFNLNIEYDEKHHFSKASRLKDAQRELEIGGLFFRIRQGKELLDFKKLCEWAGKPEKEKEKYWCVDDQYYFTDEMDAYRFCVSKNIENIKVTRKPNIPLKKVRYTCYDLDNGRLSRMYFPLVKMSDSEIKEYLEELPFLS